MTYSEQVHAARRAILVQALEAAGGNRTVAAEALGLTRTYLQRLLREHGVVVPVDRAARRPKSCSICRQPGHQYTACRGALAS